MVYFVFAYFVFLFLFIFKKRGYDVSAFVTSLYIVTSFFSILIKENDYFPESLTNPSLTSSIIYCLLITMAIYPIYRYRIDNIRGINYVKESTIKILTYFFFLCFLFVLVCYWKDILFIMAFGDWRVLRDMVRDGNLSLSTQFSGVIKYIALFIGVIGSSSFVMFPVFFVSLCFLRKPWWYNIMGLLGTTPVLLYGILAIDRSAFFYWLVMLGLCAVMFWKHLPSTVKKRYIPIVLGVVVLVIGLMTAITISRFEDKAQGTSGGIITYAGQPYYHFCDFFDNFDNREGITTKCSMPATHYWLLKDYTSFSRRQEELTNKTGKECGVFYTFLGAFILDANQIGPFVFIVFYVFVFSLFSRFFSRNLISFYLLLIYYFLALIPSCGCISYIYTSAYNNFTVILVLLMLFPSRRKGNFYISYTNK